MKYINNMPVIKYFRDYIDHINEGLIKTHSGKIVSKNLSSQLTGLDINFYIQFLEDQNIIKLTFYFFNAIPISQLDDLFDLIDSQVINIGGWFPSRMDISNIHGMKNSLRYNLDNLYLNHSKYNVVEIFYESRFDEKVDKIPNKLYHLSIGEYKKKILKCGLSPRSKNKISSHLDRIYLCGSVDDCKNLISRMNLYYNEEKIFNIYNKQKRKYQKNTIPVIFEIDNSDQFIQNLFKDANYDGGFYALDNIPPSKISIIYPE